MITLESIDYVINMTGASYDDVRVALLEADGNVDKAIKLINERGQGTKTKEEQKEEEKDGKSWREYTSKTIGHVQQSLDEILDGIKDILKKGNARKLLIEKDGETVLSLSLTVSAIGFVINPIVAILGVGAALTSEYDFKIIMEDGSTIDVKEYIKNKKEDIENKVDEKVEDLKKEENKEDDQIIIDAGEEESQKKEK
ncbi:DUF4342 domain-containing protein [Peptoniphilus sp. BV3C26]|uniref:DUF4342 domain-containing protein n=1 Tax=Peptoniphilus sp. BV3C26 TaxID=1111134 RepID=UPI0003B844EA|nr:DUF4342 domain-containing protein [Peptoniphilus sp. BV3C26]ERT58770.1 PF14242 domain protein [Peptoniphilus sp. BV3C26]